MVLRWRASDKWREVARQAVGRTAASQKVVDILAHAADEDGLVTPDSILIDQTFRRDELGVRDLRSSETIRPKSLLFHDVELWLAATAHLDLRLVERIVGRLGGGLISFWMIHGDPLNGKAELRVPEVSETRLSAYRLLLDAAGAPSGRPLPALADVPSISMPGTGWVRPADEYVRPSGRLAMVSLELAAVEARPWDFRHLDDKAAYMMGVVGLDHNRAAVRARRHSEFVWLELVPEPRNPHDHTAVAVDLEGVRIGYVAANVAYRMHPVVRYQNLDGSACFVPGAVLRGRAVQMVLPTYATLDSLIDQDLIESELVSLWKALPDPTRSAIQADKFCLTDTTLAVVSDLRSVVAPHVDIPASADQYTSRIHLARFLASRSREFREALAIQRAEEKRMSRLRAERAKLDRSLRDSRITDLARSGLSSQAIAMELGLPATIVRSVLKKAGVASASTGHNSYSEATQGERVARCAEALDMQRQGMTRAAIASAMGLAVDTVKLLLRDGRFYEVPEQFEERLSLAVHAHRGGWTRAAAGSPAERRAVNDAHALKLTRADLLD